MNSQDRFEAWAEINMPELRLQRSDLTGHFVSPATWNFLKVWSARDGEIEALRQALTECSDSLHGEMLQKFGGQLPGEMHPVTRREYDRDMAEVAGYRAAMSKGEQP